MMGIPIFQMALIGLLPSPLKVAFYRMRGAKIGKRVRIAPLAVIIAEEIEIGDDCNIGMLTFIKVRKLRLGNRVKIGMLVAIDTESVSIGHDSVVMEQTVVGGMLTPRSSLSIGCRVKIFPYCFINPTEPIIIEDDVGVGGGTYLFTHGSWQSVLDGFPIAFGPIHLKRGVWLPWRVFILPNVEIGEYATIGAGAVINKSIPPRSLAAGIPAKVLSEDGRHLNMLTSEQKWTQVVSIIEEFCEFQNYQGHRSETVKKDSDVFSLRVMTSKNHWTNLVICREINTSDSYEVVVSLSAISTEVASTYVTNRVTWFDLTSKTSNMGPHSLAEDVRNYFSRYGIRFSVVSDPSFNITNDD
jgi:acetyltransferase-like isoleucine patch superfamily enzyme